MLGLTALGVIHTAISLVAVGSGAIALIRDFAILPGSAIGKVYIVTTVLTCLTGFGIFQRGGFNKAHALGVITLLALGVAWAAGRRLLGVLSPYIETVAYSLTFFFHLVPGFTETFTRLPVGAPLAANDADPKLQAVLATCFILFLAGAALQVKKLRISLAVSPAAATSTVRPT